MGAVARSLRLHGGLPPGIAFALSSGLSVKVQIKDAADVTGGGTVAPDVGLQLVDSTDNPVAAQVVLQFAAFQDQFGATPAGTATLDTATKGTIHGGAGTAALVIETDANGEFQCSLTDLVDETVYLLCAESFKSIGLSCNDFDSVTFSA